MGQKILTTPKDLLGSDLYIALEAALRNHLDFTNDTPGPGEFPALIFGALDTGLVTRVKMLSWEKIT